MSRFPSRERELGQSYSAPAAKPLSFDSFLILRFVSHVPLSSPTWCPGGQGRNPGSLASSDWLNHVDKFCLKVNKESLTGRPARVCRPEKLSATKGDYTGPRRLKRYCLVLPLLPKVIFICFICPKIRRTHSIPVSFPFINKLYKISAMKEIRSAKTPADSPAAIVGGTSNFPIHLSGKTGWPRQPGGLLCFHANATIVCRDGQTTIPNATW